MIKRVYLAGPISGLDYDGCNDWREYVSKYLNVPGGVNGTTIEVMSPMRGKAFLKGTGPISATLNPTNHPMRTDAAITTRDRNDIMTSDVIIMNLLDAKIVSIGTMIEAGWADAFRKPVVLVMEDNDNIHEHTILRRIAGYRVNNLDAAIEIVKLILLPE